MSLFKFKQRKRLDRCTILASYDFFLVPTSWPRVNSRSEDQNLFKCILRLSTLNTYWNITRKTVGQTAVLFNSGFPKLFDGLAGKQVVRGQNVFRNFRLFWTAKLRNCESDCCAVRNVCALRAREEFNSLRMWPSQI